MTKPKNLPLKARILAMHYGINLGMQETGDGDWFYFVRDPVTLAFTDTTRTAYPKACHALALVKREIARLDQQQAAMVAFVAVEKYRAGLAS